MLLLDFGRKNKKAYDFQINQTYKKTSCLLRKTGFSLNITDWIKIWQLDNVHEFPNKPWSASGLDN